MSKNWIANIGLILVTLLLATACTPQRQRPLADKLLGEQSETLEGAISLWIEQRDDLTDVQSDTTVVSEEQKSFQKALEQFKDLHPQVQIFVKSFPSGQIFEPFKLQSERGAGPDLMIFSSIRAMARFVQTGALQPLDESQVDLSQFRPKALKQARYQGKLYGLPAYLTTQVLCYNTDRVKQLPNTLDELIDQARRGYSVGVQSGFVETLWGTGIFGGQIFDDSGRFTLGQGDGWVKWLKWLKAAQNEPNFILSNSATGLKQAFVEGNLAYLTCSSSWLSYFRDTLGKDKVGAIRLPHATNQPATPVLWTSLFLFNRASSPNQARVALKLAQFLTNAEQQSQFESAIPMISTNRNVTIDRDLFPVRSVLFEQSKSAVPVSLDDVQKLKVINDYGNTLYRKVLAGEMTPEGAASQLQLTVNRQFGWN
jgi:ABC-type glycerol-3-phosphate transport system substrate-binding protein